MIDSACICPMQNNCKHAAALVLRWVG
ncbi:MAG: SWIM zinc finger family protein, partial [Burkholderiales bacterium]